MTFHPCLFLVFVLQLCRLLMKLLINSKKLILTLIHQILISCLTSTNLHCSLTREMTFHLICSYFSCCRLLVKLLINLKKLILTLIHQILVISWLTSTNLHYSLTSEITFHLICSNFSCCKLVMKLLINSKNLILTLIYQILVISWLVVVDYSDKHIKALPKFALEVRI